MVEITFEKSAALGRKGWGRALWESMRPWQWIKNLFVLAPLFFSRRLFVVESGMRALVIFFLFCCMSSAVYLLNDVLDRERDRRHPRKQFRPIAAGELRVHTALGAMAGLVLVAVLGGVCLGNNVAAFLGGYWLLNVGYSVWLKRQVILDVLCVAAGFVLRVVGGGAAILVEVSPWLLLCTMLVSLFLALSKRRQELLLLGEDAARHRKVLAEYTPQFLDQLLGAVIASTIMSYALYTVSEETARRFSTRGLLWTWPFVLYGLFRYLYVLYREPREDDPLHGFLNDWPLLINLGLWGGVTGVIIYWR